MRRAPAITRMAHRSFADTKFGEDAVEQIIRRRLAGNLAQRGERRAQVNRDEVERQPIAQRLLRRAQMLPGAAQRILVPRAGDYHVSRMEFAVERQSSDSLRQRL